MDFHSLMEAASSNKVKAAVETKTSTMLKTKLAPPKKDAKKKVDVEAIKKRLEEEKRRLEPPKPKPVVKKPEKRKLDQVKEKPKPDKSKYENTQHEQKHQLFMKNIKRIGAKVEKKPEPKKEPVKTEKPKQKLPAKKQSPKPPNFKELMALAENARKDPKLLQDFNKKNKPDPQTGRSSPFDNKLKPSPGSAKGKSQLQPSCSKLSKAPSYTKTLRKPGSSETRNISNTVPKTQSTSEESHKQESTKKTDHTPKISRKPGPSHTIGPANGLSEAQRAKLAMRNTGKRPAPPQPSNQPQPKISAPEQNNKQVHQKPANRGAGQKRSHESKPVDSEPVKKKSLNPYLSEDGKSTWDRLHPQPKEPKSKSNNRRYIDSEDEYDDYDDMDDFIDDGDEQVDISSAIRDIFGYDKRKYKDEEFDDRSMVAGFADIMKEEVRSAKIAAQEDLEEQRKEDEARLRKLEKKKKKR